MNWRDHKRMSLARLVGLVTSVFVLSCDNDKCPEGLVPDDVRQACVRPTDAGADRDGSGSRELGQSSAGDGAEAGIVMSTSAAGVSGAMREAGAAAAVDGAMGDAAGAGASAATRGGASSEPPPAPCAARAPSASADGCCPDGANVSVDPDCQPKCGNGIREGSEFCDGADCPDSCPTSNACLVARITGAAATCDAICGSATEIAECKSGDGCCAKGCTYANDDDCSKSCGDGSVDMPERCEPTSKDKPCPESCEDGDPCTQDVMSGSAEQCSAECTYIKVTSLRAGDGCCPDGANANNDSDCKAACGNGVVESGETCDGDCPTSSSCTGGSGCSRRRLSGFGCAVECVTVEITERTRGDGCCPDGANANNDSDCEAKCGNGVVESGETCDGDCPTSSSCAGGSGCSRRKLSGSGCAVECMTVEITESNDGDGCCPDGANANNDSDCEAKCGNGVVESGERCDGNCPTSSICTGGSGCSRRALSGSGCAVECKTVEITEHSDGDGCCPSGATNTNDNDCAPPPAVCGNGLKEAGEDCDPKASGEVVGYSCDSSCRRLNRLTPCNDEQPGQCPGAPPSICDSGFCRPTCPNLQLGSLCEPLPGATRNESVCTGSEPRACAWLCSLDDPEAYCGPFLWCDGTYCRVKPQ